MSVPIPVLDPRLVGTRCERCGRDSSDWENCNRAWGDCAHPPDRSKPFAPKTIERPATRIISVTEPGYDVALFMNADGGAEAVITRPHEKPTGVNIAPPGRGRRIVVERKNGTFDVMYKDVT